ncbi:ABC transporter ATP-binding protein [Acidobacteriota bacterium]
MSAPALKFEEVTRRFGRVTALNRVSLAVEPGTVLGLMGRNAAGKTTALRLAHGILYADGGSIRVLGLDPAKEGMEVRTRVSLLSEEPSLYPWMTVQEIIRFSSALHPNWDPDLAESYRKKLDLNPSARIGTLSRGNKAKAALLLAVSSRPEILLLDDPTASLDPLARREVLEGILEAIPAEGGAVVYASHLVGDIERVADRIALLDEGRLRFADPLDALKKRVKRVTAVFENEIPAKVSLPGLIDSTGDGRLLILTLENPDDGTAEALRSMGARNVSIDALSLEDILVAYLRQGIEPEKEEVRHV